MIVETYKGISKEVIDAMKPLIRKTDHYHHGHARRMARTLQVILDQKPQGKFLEVGTTALIPLVLSKLAPELDITVTDFNLDKPKLGEDTFTLQEESINLKVARVNIEDEPLPFEDEFFDFILLSEVIEHMEVDPMYMLSEINRVLKTGGTLVVTTPNCASTWAIHKILHGIEPYFYMQYRHDRSPYRHNYEYSIHSLTAVLKAAGFNGSTWTEDSFEEPNISIGLRLEKIGIKIQHTGDNIFSVAKKVSSVIERYPKVIYAD
jgi:ubiquinone/menaquinone biosynthesis C-methylase UbiE